MVELKRGQLLENRTSPLEVIVVKVCNDAVFTVFFTMEGMKSIVLPNQLIMVWAHYELIGQAMVTPDMDEFIKTWATYPSFAKYFKEVAQ